MTREIKFRGKTNNGNWLVGEIISLNNHKYIAPNEGDWFDFIEWVPENVFHAPDSDKYEVEESTIGQFTGLHDMNGKDIYEGDIMGLPEQDANGVKYKNRYVRVVEWVNDGFFLVDNCMMGGEVRKYGDRLALEISLKSEYAGIASCFEERGLDYCVIGNIHDNPELLKKA